MTLGAVSAVSAQSPTPVTISGPPDVLILVYQQPGKNDKVDITYSHTLPHAQAQRDLAALASATRWPIGAGKVADGLPPVQNKIGPMTSSTFELPNLIRDDTHTLPVDPFITAFRAYKRLNLIFSVGPAFVFQGQGNYADNNVHYTLDQRGTMYTYQVQILNPNFEHLGLPASGSAASATPKSGSRLKSLLSLAFLAVGLGALVYLYLARGARAAHNNRSL